MSSVSVSVRSHTCVGAGYEGKLTLILVCVQALQGADHLTPLPCVHTTNLQTVQVVTHVPVIKQTKTEIPSERNEWCIFL